MKALWSVISLVAGVCTSMIGFTIHGGWFWTTCDFFLWPLALAKWLVFHEINHSVIKNTFSFLAS